MFIIVKMMESSSVLVPLIPNASFIKAIWKDPVILVLWLKMSFSLVIKVIKV